jgi:hypothetical protein
MMTTCVEIWDDKDNHIEESIALTSDYATAKSAMRQRSSEGLEGSSRFARRRG